MSAAARVARAAAWAAVRDHDADAMLAVASNLSADAESLAIIVHSWDQVGQLPVAVALAVLGHPRCPGGLADRLARHPDPVVRMGCIAHGGCGATGIACLLADRSPDVRAAAEAAWPG